MQNYHDWSFYMASVVLPDKWQKSSLQAVSSFLAYHYFSVPLILFWFKTNTYQCTVHKDHQWWQQGRQTVCKIQKYSARGHRVSHWWNLWTSIDLRKTQCFVVTVALERCFIDRNCETSWVGSTNQTLSHVAFHYAHIW